MDYFTQAMGLYEGIPLIPYLYSNSRSKKNFGKIQALTNTIIWIFILGFAPLCILAWRSNLREIVLLNLEFGEIETIIKLLYPLCLYYNIAINLIPMVGLFNNLKERFTIDETN